MSFLKIAPTRIFCTTLVVASLVQQEVAVAAILTTKVAASVSSAEATSTQQAFQVPDNLSEAVDLVNVAKTRSVNEYFAKGGKPEEIAAFLKDIDVLIKTNAQIKFVKDPKEFKAWFAANQASIILNRSNMGDDNIQNLIVNTYFAYRAAQALENKDVNAYWLWIRDTLMEPSTWISGALSTGLAILIGTRALVGNALGAGTGGRLVNAYLGPIIRVLEGKLSVRGNRHLSGIAEWMNTEQKLLETRSQIENREKAMEATRQLMSARGFEISREDAGKSIESLKANWLDAKQIWESTNVPDYRDGRAYTVDNLILRPTVLSTSIVGTMTAEEVFRQGIEAHIDRISAASPQASKVQGAVDSFLQEVKLAEHARLNFPKDYSARLKKLEAARSELMSIGATETQTERMAESQRRVLLVYRQQAVTLAGVTLFDLMYSEFNRELPAETAQAYEAFKSNYCFDYFQAEFGHEIARLLKLFGIPLRVQKAKIDADLKQVQAKIAEANKGEKLQRPKSELAAKRVETRTHRAVIIPDRIAIPLEREALRLENRKTKTAARQALGDFVSSKENRTAAAGAEELKAGRKKSIAERAREAAARAARK